MGISVRCRTVRGGVNLHEQSESEQECESYGGDNPAAIDHSVGNRRRRVGLLLGFGLSSPLALAASKHKTPISRTTLRDRLCQIESAKHRGTESLELSRNVL